jgi:bis(5'-nucleosidyl)-tetraphosphatase
MKQEVSAGVIVYRRDATTKEPLYLVLHYISGHWDFAKGKLEGVETKRQAAIRELMEETGLTAQLQDDFEQSLSYYFKNRKGEMVDKEVTFFVGEANSDKVTLSREHVYHKWLPFHEAIKQLTYDNARLILTRANQILQPEL